MWRSTCLVATQDKAFLEIPLLIKSVTTNLECSASFFDLSLTSVHGGQFQISPGKFPSLWTNNWLASQVTKEMGLAKETSTWEILKWSSTFMRGGVAHILNTCKHLVRRCSENASWSTMFVWVIVHNACGKEGERMMVSAMGSSAGHRCPTRSWSSN